MGIIISYVNKAKYIAVNKFFNVLSWKYNKNKMKKRYQMGLHVILPS